MRGHKHQIYEPHRTEWASGNRCRILPDSTGNYLSRNEFLHTPRKLVRSFGHPVGSQCVELLLVSGVVYAVFHIKFFKDATSIAIHCDFMKVRGAREPNLDSIHLNFSSAAGSLSPG